MCLRYRPCHHVGNSRTRINSPSPLLAWSSRPPPSSRCMCGIPREGDWERRLGRGRGRESTRVVDAEMASKAQEAGQREAPSTISPRGALPGTGTGPKPCHTASAGGPMRAAEWRGRLPDLDTFDSLRDCFLHVPQRQRRLILSHLRRRWAKLLVVIHHGELEALRTPIFLTP